MDIVDPTADKTVDALMKLDLRPAWTSKRLQKSTVSGPELGRPRLLISPANRRADELASHHGTATVSGAGLARWA